MEGFLGQSEEVGDFLSRLPIWKYEANVAPGSESCAGKEPGDRVIFRGYGRAGGLAD